MLPLMSTVYHQMHLQQAQTHQQWALDDLKIVVCSDESWEQICHPQDKLWHQQHEVIGRAWLQRAYLIAEPSAIMDVTNIDNGSTPCTVGVPVPWCTGTVSVRRQHIHHESVMGIVD